MHKVKFFLAVTIFVISAFLFTSCAQTAPPLFLTIVEPANESVVGVNTVTIQGKTLADAVVSINGGPVDVDSSGNFLLPVTLEEGPNVFDIIATDEAGDEVTTQLVVSFAP